jgi:uncharacterized protein YjbJ (UPF0337 family)
VSSDKAEEARKGLFGTMAGKPKEVAGALSGNDELATEGQLQQAGERQAASRHPDQATS